MGHLVRCRHCQLERWLKHPPTGSMCRACAARFGSAASASRVRPSAQERFESKVVKSDDCWLWKGNTTSNGYGQFFVARQALIAHRYSHELHVGPIPAGLEIDHLCNVRACVRPDHLEPVTHAENMRRKAVRDVA